MTEPRAVYRTEAPTNAERIRPIAEWLERELAPLMEAGERAQLTFHVKGDKISAQLTIVQSWELS